MDFTLIDNLLSETKKNDASQAKKTEFKHEFMKLLSEEGYNNGVEKYLFAGVSYGSIDTLIEWIKINKDNNLGIYNKVVLGKSFKANEKGNSFKVIVALLCLLLNESDKSYDEIIKDILVRIELLSKNKENIRFKDASKTFGKYFIEKLSMEANLPNLNNLGVKEVCINSFKSMVKEFIEVPKFAKKTDLEKVEKIRFWINGLVSFGPDELQNNENEMKLKKDDLTSKKFNKAKVLIEIADYLQNLERERNLLKIRSDRLENELIKINIQRENLERLLQNNRDVILNANIIIDQINNENMKQKNKIEEQEFKIEEQLAQISKQKMVLSLFESHQTNSQQEKLNTIAAQLKTEYNDFRDAVEMDMTLDLGENLRQQMTQIFKILAKNHIEIDKR